MPIKILFSDDSVRNTTAACDSLGIHYNIAKEKFGLNAVRRVEKWDKETNQNVLVAEFKLPGFGLDKIKWPGDTDWRPMSEFLAMSSEAFSYSARNFRGTNGVEYRWKRKGTTLEMFYVSKDISTEPLTRYHRNFLQKEPGCLDILDSSVMETLDHVIVSFLIMEQRRRD